MKVEKTTTGLIIHAPTSEVKRKVLYFFSLNNPTREYFIYSGNDTSKKPLFGKEHDVIYITSGFGAIKDQVIQSMMKHHDKITPPTPQKIDLTIARTPRSKLQEDCIDSLTKSTESKITVELKPGTGKTFIALKAISILGLKPLIVAPTTLLKNQWIENFVDDGILESDIAKNIYDAPSKKLCVVTISAMENELRKDWEGLLKVINDSRFGIKIVDEAHLHLKGVLRLDAICNIPHNWYLSATLGRSSVEEDNVLNRALMDAKRFVGNSAYKEYQDEYINVYLQDIWYYPSFKLCNDTFKYGTKGLIKPTYYNMLMKYKDGRPFINSVIRLIKIAKHIVKDDEKRIVILVPMLNIIDAIMAVMEKDSYFDKYKIVSIDGSMSIAVRKEKLEYGDIIFSTSMSLGTGVDISNLIAVINFDQYASSIITEQIAGRCRQRGWDCYYFDICDHVKYARTLENWGRKRRTVLPYFPGVKPDMNRLPNIYN